MQYVEAPYFDFWESDAIKVFLAGGITDCPDWQAEAVRLFDAYDGEPEAGRLPASWERIQLAHLGPSDTVELGGFARPVSTELMVLSPRRANFPIHDPAAAAEQIEWEYQALRAADVVLFWFPKSTSAQPIALFELGAHSANPVKRIVVGADPAYSRRQDVEIQLRLVRGPRFPVHSDLATTCMAALRIYSSMAATCRTDRIS